MTAEIVNLSTYRKAKRRADKKVAESFMLSGQEKAEQRRLEYEKGRTRGQVNQKKLDDTPPHKNI
ncbi:MAG: hypothetical protein CMF69_12480 [Magnetovibrio sp.]|nr:hypothetical protein [Magnetovibrio sp.]|tara:strand:- start:708 stop:902 length:195 start_codon:yes stop_codon:yes gene_type:complete